MFSFININNERIKGLSKLHNKKYRDEEKEFLIEGDHLIKEAINKGYVEEIFLLDGTDNIFDFDNVTYVTKEVLNKLSEQESSTNMIAVCKFIENENIGDKVILLDGLQDPGNLGTIIRSASAFGFDIVLGDNYFDTTINDIFLNPQEYYNKNIEIEGMYLLNFLKNMDSTDAITRLALHFKKSFKNEKTILYYHRFGSNCFCESTMGQQPIYQHFHRQHFG